MTTTTSPASDRRSMVAPQSRAGRRPRTFFYGGLAVAAIITVLTGFARTYFLHGYTGTAPFRSGVHLHATVFTTWLLLFLVQTVLIASGRVRLHRKLGVMVVAWGAVMVVIGYSLAIESARRGFIGIFDPPAPGTRDALIFSTLGFADLLLFLTFLGAGIYFRSRPEIHKRLMVLALMNLLPPALFRLPLGTFHIPVAFVLMTGFLAATPLHDRLSGRRVHPVSLWGGLVVLVSGPLRLAIGTTGVWQRFATWLIT